MGKTYYSGYILKWTMNWAGASTDPAQPTVIPVSAENWLFIDNGQWVASPGGKLTVWAPPGQGSPTLDFLAYMTFPDAQTSPPANLNMSVNAVKKGNGQPGQGNNPFSSDLPISMAGTPQTSGDNITFQFNGVPQSVTKKGDYGITVAINCPNGSGGTCYWRVDPEMDVSTDQ